MNQFVEKHSPGEQKIRWAVLIPVALNLFLIGVIAAPFLESGSRMKPPFPPPEFMTEYLAQDLPPKDADILRDIFAGAKDGMHRRHEAERKAFRRLADILRQETPDLRAMRQVFDDIEASGQALHEGMAKAVQRLATELPLKSRRKIAAFLERGPPMPPPDHGPGGPPMMSSGNMPPPPPMGER